MHDTGIYCITDVQSGRRYVGSAVHFKRRWRLHVDQLRGGKHHSKFLQRTFNQRPHAIRFERLIYCARADLIMYEQRFLDAWKPEFNGAPTAGSMLGFRFTDESRLKMSHAAKRTKNFTGKTHSEESKRKISDSRKGKGGGYRSPERCANISKSLKGRVVTPEMRARISATLTGTSTGRGKLTPDQVREIRRLRETGLGRISIGRILGLPASTVNSVTGNHAYGWVK